MRVGYCSHVLSNTRLKFSMRGNIYAAGPVLEEYLQVFLCSWQLWSSLIPICNAESCFVYSAKLQRQNLILCVEKGEV